MTINNNRYKYPEGFWEQHKEEIIHRYVENRETSGAIAKDYGCWATTIIGYLKKWNVPIRNYYSDEQYNNIYDANIYYFDKIDCSEKAYWLGYIAADGSVPDETALMLGCSYVDSDIIYKFKDCIQSNHPIGINKDGNPIFNIASKHLAKTLKGYGLSHDKTYNLHLKETIKYVPEEFQTDFFRGLFDGDGSIKFYNYEYVKGYQYHFGFTGVKESVELFSERFRIRTKIVDEGNEIFTIRTANAPHIYWCLHELYDNASIYCNRKFFTVQNVFRLIDKENKNIVRGVSFEKSSNKWVAQINKDKKHLKIGRYDTREEAESARLQYEYNQYGENSPQWFFFEKYGIGIKNE